VSPPQDGGEWHILGHTYWNRAWSDATFAFETHDPPATAALLAALAEAATSATAARSS